MQSALENQPFLSVVIPVHNSSDVIERTVRSWLEFLGDSDGQILLVENGSTDGSLEMIQSLLDVLGDRRIELLRSEKGMGNALRVGIAASKGDYLLLSADDLPFGFDDVTAAAALNWSFPLMIGSKAHPESEVDRNLSRALFSIVFRGLRRVVLGSKVGDSQGTFILNGDWGRAVEPFLQEQGYLLTTELVYAAELQDIGIVEVPVHLKGHHSEKESSIRARDVIAMATGLRRLRARRRELLVARFAISS